MKPLNQLTITEVLEGYSAGDFSAIEVTKACLDQINKLNKDLNAYLTINSNALDDAKKADTLLKQKDWILKYPLLGVPIAVKDNFLTKNLRTTASSKVLDNYNPQFDSTVVKKLKDSGAIILGKTNMDAWAHGSSTETSAYGPTLNPHNLGHLPGGSSGGSAAVVAAHMCIAAIGSETAGSIRQPAAWCGVTGFKPTYGRVSRYGVIAMASSTDSPGPITKTVEDSAIVLNVLAGKDDFDATTINESFTPLKNQEESIKGIKIGLPQEYLLDEMEDSVKEVILNAANKLEELGAKVEKTSLIDPHYSIGVYTILQRSEVSSNLARFDGIRYGNDRSHFGDEALRRMMLGSFSLSSGYYDAYYKNAQKVRTLIVQDFDKAFKKYDVLIGPTSPGPALKVGASKDQPMFGEMEDILVEASSIAGLTGTSLPCGFVNSLPIGLQITGPQKAEAKVHQVSLAYQRATNWHKQLPNL